MEKSIKYYQFVFVHSYLNINLFKTNFIEA